MKIEKFVCGLLRENCYVLLHNNSVIIVDPGWRFDDIWGCINDNDITTCAVLLTHGHFDHIGACKQLQDKGLKIYIHELDADKCLHKEKSLASGRKNIDIFEPDVLLTGERCIFNIGDFKVTMIHTPGHSAGSCCYIIDNYLFSGDTLFLNGYGRTDLYDGDECNMQKSLAMLSAIIDKDTILCPGHD